MKKYIFLGMLALLCGFATAQKTYTQGVCGGANASRWDCGNNWSPNGEPTASTNAIISNGGTGVCNVVQADDVCNNLTINAGATLNINGTLVVHGNLTVNGTLSIKTGGNLTVNGSILINAGGTISDDRIGSGSFNIAGTSITNNGTLAQPGTLYANLTNSGTITISGTSSDYDNFAFSLVTSGQTVNFNANTTNLYGFSINQGTTLNIGVGRTVSMIQLSIRGNANFNNATISISGGTSSSVSPDGVNPYFPTGQIGEGTFNAGTSTVIYDGGVDQIVRSATYYNLTVRNYYTRTKGLGNAYISTAFGQTLPITVSNDLSLEVTSSGGVTATFNPVNISRHFNLATNNSALSMDLYADHLMQRTGASGSFTMGNNANNRIFVGYAHATNTFLQGYGNANTFFGTVVYDGLSGVQKVVGATYNNLNAQNGATRELMANTLVNNNITITGGTFDVTTSNFNLDVKGNWIHTGGNFNPRTATVSFTGTTDQILSTVAAVGSTSNFTNTPAPVNIPDNTPVALDNDVPTLANLAGKANIAVTVPAGTYYGLYSIGFNISHTWTGDLDIYLVTPDNTVYVVSTDNGGWGDNYTNTVIRDGFSNISTGSAPFTGTFSWEDTRLMSSYAGPMAGTWTLYVVDDLSSDTGKINSFTVTLITSLNPLTFHNLTVNKAGNLTLAGTSPAVQVNGTGTFNNGYLVTTATRRLDFAAGSSVSGGSNASHIVGTARKIGNTAFTFPLGNGTYYAGIGFNPSGTTAPTDHFTATYTRTSPNSLYPIANKEVTIDHVSNCEYWMLDRTNGSQSATVSLHFDDVRSCGVDNLSQLIVCRWNGSQWTDGGNGSISGSFVTSATTFTSFSPFSLGSSGSNNPLPVGLKSFQAKGVASDALLTWETSSELNAAGFVVERSLNAKDFEPILSVEAVGKANKYQYTDRGIGIKFMEVYYRLKSIDVDGKYTYSLIEAVNFGEKEFALVSINPNPIQQDFAVWYDVPATGKVQISITDALGKLVDRRVVEAKSGRNQYQYSHTNHLASGIYILSLQYEGQIVSKKIVK